MLLSCDAEDAEVVLYENQPSFRGALFLHLKLGGEKMVAFSCSNSWFTLGALSGVSDAINAR